ncbi:unnamed protein product [Penicillium salamii]|uniref:RING-type domain-containing protein n=1 Tax=Penicillium salamii TaxID=1612424 RepID=A0A9W4NS08_9EURO|nr:unnamed protein product [Penicillium salamii]CAG7953155.1 unnamed protein product [Penicillium salamii]CAG7961906.1 unnamed protein product [Penicillium salamii]CAG8022734.1 unnamed protein product [Penicillium salamii]CAG8084941.1 unnamed protein product [Penicillium salamii]
MPSRNYPTSNQPSLSLSEILELEPEEEPWCAGYAPSQRRRCHIRTNSRGRSSAMALLDKGTEKLQAGRNIDNLLEDLAPHVLCTRFHQNQASTLTSSWRRKVRSYLDSQSTPTRSTRGASSTPRASLRPRSISSEPVDLATDERIADLRRRIEALKELRRLEGSRSGRERTIRSHSRETENSSRTVSPSGLGSSLGRNSSLERYTERVAERASTEVTVRSVTAVPRPAQAHIAAPRQVSVSTQSPQSPSTVVSVPRRTVIYGRKSRLPQVTRREVEGDCGICLCDLHGPQQAVDWEDETDNDSDDEEDDDSDDDEEEDDSEDDEEDDSEDDEDDDSEEEEDDSEDDGKYYDANEYQEELTWCKIGCGVNFHKKCIDKWLACARTCPACRSKWEDMD